MGKLKLAMDNENSEYFVPGKYNQLGNGGSDSEEEALVHIEPVQRDIENEEIVAEATNEFVTELVRDLKLRFYDGGFNTIIADLSTCFDYRGFVVESHHLKTGNSPLANGNRLLLIYKGDQKGSISI